MRGPRFILLALFHAFVGLVAAATLVYEHNNLALLDRFCGAGSCIQVLTSRYSSPAGIPLPLFGLAFYITILAALLATLALPDNRARRIILAGAQVLALLALAASAVLMVIQFAVIRGFCPLCTLSAFCVLMLAALCYLARRDGPWPCEPGIAVALALSFAVITILFRHFMLQSAPVSHNQILARIDGALLTTRQMDREGDPQVRELQAMLYNARLSWIDRRISSILIQREARRQGISPDALVDREVEQKIQPAMASLEKWLAEQKKTLDEEEWYATRRRAVSELRQKRMREWVQSLRAGHDIQILVQPPDGPALKFDPALAHHLGPENAPIRLVLFADFECPYCAEMAGTLRRVMERFPFEVSLDFLHLPIEGHKQAFAAAVASECAAEQGKFWLFHDQIAKRGGQLEGNWEKQLIRESGLDPEKFAACKQSPGPRQRVERSLREAKAMGLDAIPALFLNGRYIGGMLSDDELTDLIRLERQQMIPSGRPATAPAN